MWVTTAIAVEKNSELDEAHTCQIVRLGQQTDQYMRTEVFKELENETDDTDLHELFHVFVSRHKLPPIAVTVVTWQDIFDGAKLTDGCSVGRVLYGHGVTDEDKEWQRILDEEYDEVMADVDDDEKVDRDDYLRQAREESMCQVTETMVTDE